MSDYIRSDFSCWFEKKIYYIIPTIEIYKWIKSVEISILFLCFRLSVNISYIKEDDYES